MFWQCLRPTASTPRPSPGDTLGRRSRLPSQSWLHYCRTNISTERFRCQSHRHHPSRSGHSQGRVRRSRYPRRFHLPPGRGPRPHQPLQTLDFCARNVGDIPLSARKDLLAKNRPRLSRLLKWHHRASQGSQTHALQPNLKHRPASNRRARKSYLERQPHLPRDTSPARPPGQDPRMPALLPHLRANRTDPQPALLWCDKHRPFEIRHRDLLLPDTATQDHLLVHRSPDGPPAKQTPLCDAV